MTCPLGSVWPVFLQIGDKVPTTVAPSGGTKSPVHRGKRQIKTKQSEQCFKINLDCE